MRKNFQRIMAVVVSLVVACSMMLGGLGLQFVQAEDVTEAGGSNSDGVNNDVNNSDGEGSNNDGSNDATITISFRDNSAAYGKVIITTGGSNWINCVAGQAVSASAVRIVPDNGYEVDWGGISLRLENSETFLLDNETDESSANEIKNALLSNEGYSLTDNNVYELEQVEFKAINETPGETETSSSITLGATVLFQDGNVTNDYHSFSGVSDGKIAIDKQDNGEPRITFDQYDGSAQTLRIEGNASLVVKKGTTELWSITLGEHTRLDVDAMDTEVSEPAELLLAEGIHAADAERPADSIRFTNNMMLNIGSEEHRATKAFSGIGTVTLENFEFHSRATVNTNIYATTAFSEVEKVDIQCAKVLVNAKEVLFDRTAGGDTTDCTVYTEGQIQLQGTIGDGTLKSTYYFKYPTGPVERNQMDQSCNISSCMTTHEITAAELSAGISASDSLDPGCTLIVNPQNSNDITLTSTDPILYSVSYQIDDYITFPNPTCGAVTMNGFTRGFYTVDGTDGRFEAWIAAGETVNVTILPDQGYQYQKDTLNINGQVIENTIPGTDRGTYTFTMPANAGHICAGFAKTSDIVSVTNENIASANLANTDGVITNGNAKLQIASATVSEEDAAKIASAAGDHTVADTLDIDLYEAVIKNYDPTSQVQDSWDKELHELDSPVAISVGLGEGLRGGSSYEVVRVHGGVAEVLTDAQYDAQTGTLTFQTDKFSTYAILKKAGTTGGNSGESSGDNSGGSQPGGSGGDSSGGSSSSSSGGAGGGSSSSSSGGSQSGGSGSSSSGSSTPAADTTTDNTKTETKSDGTKVETTTDTKSDGTKVTTTVETKTDGTKTETVVETAKDGSIKTTETVMKADGSATKTEKETETNTKGNKVAITVTTEKDAKGKVTGITQTSEIEQISGSASATVTVEKAADGKTISAEAEVDKKGANSKKGVSATLSGSVIAQIEEAAKTKSVNISMTVTAGEKEYTVKADTKDLKAGNKLKVMSIDEKTGNYVMVNAKTYTVNKSGSVKVVLPEGMTYQLMDTKEAAAIEKQILSTVKAKKTAVTVEKGKKTAIQLSKKLDMDNVEKIDYSTSKKAVATVNKNGTVTTKQTGKVTIQAEVLLRNGKTKTVKMTVTVKP